MTTLNNWENEIKNVGHENLKKYSKAFNVLLNWTFFAVAYNGLGIPVVKAIVDNEIKSRINKPSVVSNE